MSGPNAENVDNQDEEPSDSSEKSTSICDGSSHSGSSNSSSSSGSSCSTPSTVSKTSASTSTISCGSNHCHHHPEADSDNLQSRQQELCHTSKPGHSSRQELRKINDYDEVINKLHLSQGQTCDNLPVTNCPSATIATVASTSATKLAVSSNHENPSSPTLIQSPTLEEKQHHRDTLGRSLSRVDKSVSARLLADVPKSKHDRQNSSRYNLGNIISSLGSSYSNLISATSTIESNDYSEQQSRLNLEPTSSASPLLSALDTNNNKNGDNIASSREGSSSAKRTNFSKSASGSRLINKNRPSVCDCLSQDCNEAKHSNRRHFIEQYYNSRTQLPSGNTSTSSFNISTPLNRLSECDAITKRLLSSPIRTTNPTENVTRCSQTAELDRSRRASLGTNKITDQMFMFARNPFKSLELGTKKNEEYKTGNKSDCDLDSSPNIAENDIKLKQQQVRSLSVCDEETLNPKHRGQSSNHSSNLNRAVSLACETKTSAIPRRLLTIIPLFGCDIRTLEQFTRLGLVLPPVIDSAVGHLLVNGINSVGIFRKSGVKSRILTLRQRIESNQDIKFEDLNQNNEFSIYDIADLVKMWFRELRPVPLMTVELIKLITSHVGVNSSPSAQQASVLKRRNSSQQEIYATAGPVSMVQDKLEDHDLKNKIESMTTITHRALLSKAMQFLAQISSKCDANQMTSQNLAICLTPSLCATDSDQSSIHMAQRALEFCIDNQHILFD